jgi:hypothetical protein
MKKTHRPINWGISLFAPGEFRKSAAKARRTSSSSSVPSRRAYRPCSADHRRP